MLRQIPDTSDSKAYAMDSTDVHFSSKFARLALEQGDTDLAGTVLKRVNSIVIAFERVFPVKYRGHSWPPTRRFRFKIN